MDFGLISLNVVFKGTFDDRSALVHIIRKITKDHACGKWKKKYLSQLKSYSRGENEIKIKYYDEIFGYPTFMICTEHD